MHCLILVNLRFYMCDSVSIYSYLSAHRWWWSSNIFKDTKNTFIKIIIDYNTNKYDITIKNCNDKQKICN